MRFDDVARSLLVGTAGLLTVFALACGGGSRAPAASPTPRESSTPTAAATPTPQPHVGQIAYVSPNGNIGVVRADGTGARQLTTDGRNSSPRWSPDGRRIAFLHGDAADGEGLQGDGQVLEVMDADGSNRSRLTESFPAFPSRAGTAGLSNVRWSADACTIYVHVAPGPVSMHPIHAEPLCGGAAADVSFAHFFDVRDDGVFARAWTGAGFSNRIEIGLLDDVNPITVLDAYGPVSWSPDGARLALNTGSEVEILDASGQIISSLSPPDLDGFSALDGTIDWSPDGQSLVYEAVSGLMIFALATGETTVLVEGSQPDWTMSPASETGTPPSTPTDTPKPLGRLDEILGNGEVLAVRPLARPNLIYAVKIGHEVTAWKHDIANGFEREILEYAERAEAQHSFNTWEEQPPGVALAANRELPVYTSADGMFTYDLSHRYGARTPVSGPKRIRR